MTDDANCLICELTGCISRAYLAAARDREAALRGPMPLWSERLRTRFGAVLDHRVNQYKQDLQLVTEHPHTQEA